MDIMKIMHFVWRTCRNAICFVPGTRVILFPGNKLSERFGRSDAEYAWSVFNNHHKRLLDSGYHGARRILEAGPGRNIGTSVLFWAREISNLPNDSKVKIVLWDIYKNVTIDFDFWKCCANNLLTDYQKERYSIDTKMVDVLMDVEKGQRVPDISYIVCSSFQLPVKCKNQSFDLIYSQATLEHAWHIQTTWDALLEVTRLGGWHSHRIDLADHGRRDTNYVEMLEWPEWAYWLTMRYIPGAINRWRSRDHVNYLKKRGFTILQEFRDVRSNLPIDKSYVSK